MRRSKKTDPLLAGGKTESARSMHLGVTDVLGKRIVNGELGLGAQLSLATIEAEFGVSRTVAREAMLRLQALGMLDVQRRVGLVVMGEAGWDVLNPLVIAWRLEGPDRDSQLRSLTELRVAIEPMAGRLAATHASEAERRQLVDLAAAVQDLGSRGLGRTDEYLMADVEFHQTLLRASRNEMLAALAEAVRAVMVGRTRVGMSPDFPVPEVVDHHRTAALAISHRMPEAAEVCCRSLVSRVLQEFAPPTS